MQVLEKKEILSHATRMNLENIMLSKTKSFTKKTIYKSTQMKNLT
jgi:hypothetical protein